MSFCDNLTLLVKYGDTNVDDTEWRVLLYKILVPILLVGCLISLFLNAILVAVGSMSRNGIRSRSPILVLSLNLAATDGLASFLMGIGLVLNSFLPVVLNVNMAGNRIECIILALELLRMTALIASAMHLLALALVHYKGIANPLHYRSVIFCSQHRTRSIHLMTIICWIVPALFFSMYFSTIPCQGFLTSNCRSEFILTFRYRSIVMVAFFIPLILMSFLYLRIFAIIKRHQAQRAIQRQQSYHISDQSHTLFETPKKTETIVKNCAQDGKFQTNIPDYIIRPINKKNMTESPEMSPKRQMCLAPKYDCSLSSSGVAETCITPTNHSQHQQQHHHHHRNYSIGHNFTKFHCKCKLNDSGHDASCNTRDNDSNQSKTINVTNLKCRPMRSSHTHSINEQIDKSTNTISLRSFRSNGSTHTRQLHYASISYENNPSGGGHAKALFTTLLILGTYLICWMPAVLYFAFTCVDHCPFPITQINLKWRIIFSFIANGLVILKALVDPFIYTYRMKEMKSALNRCFAKHSFFGLICPKYEENRHRYSQQNSNSGSSTSNRVKTIQSNMNVKGIQGKVTEEQIRRAINFNELSSTESMVANPNLTSKTDEGSFQKVDNHFELQQINKLILK